MGGAARLLRKTQDEPVAALSEESNGAATAGQPLSVRVTGEIHEQATPISLRSADVLSPIRICRTAAPLSRYDRSTFYGSDGRGHIDDPRHAKTSLSELQFLTGAVACPAAGASYRG